MAELATRERLLNLQSFVNEKIGQNLDLTEGIKTLAEQGGGDDIQFTKTTLYSGTEPANVILSQSLDDFDIIEFHIKCESDDKYSKSYYTVARAVNYILLRVAGNNRWLTFTSRLTNKYVCYDWSNEEHTELRIGARRDIFIDEVKGIKITNKTVTINTIYAPIPHERTEGTIISTTNIFDNAYLFNIGGSGGWDESFIQDTPAVLYKDHPIFGNVGIIEGFTWTGVAARNVKEYEILGNAPIIGIWGLQLD